MKFVYLFSVLVIGGVLLWAYRQGAFDLRSKHTDGTVAIRRQIFAVEVADTALAREKGLAGHEPLAENEGMLFVFETPTPRTFWMKGVDFPIDIIWIAEGRVTGFAEDVQPEPDAPTYKLRHYQSPDVADMVLEVAAGTVSRVGISEGDGVNVELGK